jgi:hypothetical protein
MPAFDQVYGQSFYDYLGQHPDSGALFHGAMSGFSEQEAAAIIEAYDFSAFLSIVDIGGGQGALMAALLRNHPNLHAVIFDRSSPTDETLRLFALPDVAGRSKFVQGDFFSSVPGEADLFILKSIIHNWDDASATAILSRCRSSMSKHSRLLVAERVVPPGNSASEAKLFDINMLVTLGGRERTEAEYVILFRAAGLATA